MRSARHAATLAAATIVLWSLGWQAPAPSAQVATGRPAEAGPAAGGSFQGEGPERFLREGRIARVRDLGEGVTRPKRVTLELDGETNDAVFKNIDERRQGRVELLDGTVDLDFQDSWQTEVAAYRIDRMIGLGLVPATVERRVQGDAGSLQWWVTSMMSEAARVEQGVAVPDAEAWARLRFKVYLFDELIANVDRHLRNILVTEAFEVRLIDHSRSFRGNQGLRQPEKLERFSRALLDGLQTLTFDALKSETGRYLSDTTIRRVLGRRDAILALAEQRIAERGEAAVIYP